MPQQVNYATWAGLSLAIFICLLLARNFANETEVQRLPVQQAYDELALELDAAGILPGRGEGELLSAFAGQTLDKAKLFAPAPGASTTTELKLGTVLTAKFQGGGATFIGIRPEDYGQLKPGALRQALKKINRLPYSKQVKQIAGGPAKSFTVSVKPNGSHYSIAPGFIKEQCTYLMIY